MLVVSVVVAEWLCQACANPAMQWKSENTLQCEPSSLTSSRQSLCFITAEYSSPAGPWTPDFSPVSTSPLSMGTQGLVFYGVHLYMNSGMWTQILMLMWQVIYTLNIYPSSQIHFISFKYDFSEKGWKCGFVPSTWPSAFRIVWVLLLRRTVLFLNN